MSHTLTDKLEPTNRVLKRAQYEAFAFSLINGNVRVRNESHLDPSKHEYQVTVVNGVPVTCECPADATYDGPCKHRVAVAIRPDILEVATRMRLVADGGGTAIDNRSSEQSDSADSEQCDCDDLDKDLPCWDCVRTGRRSLPE